MKNQIILFLLTALFLVSCSSDPALETSQTKEAFDGTGWPKKWKLIEMSGNISTMPPQRGSDMSWQEWYVLYPNNTFNKTRERDGATTQVKGTYSIIINEHERFIEFRHEFDNPLIGNCTDELAELLSMRGESRLIGTWLNCDGPGLIYEQVKCDCPQEMP